jgi:hypothetical protein
VPGAYVITGALAELIYSAVGPAPILVLFTDEASRVPECTLETFSIPGHDPETFTVPAYDAETFALSGAP